MTTTLVVEENGGKIEWPQEITNEAIAIVYMHSSLIFDRDKNSIDSALLYEAWAFDNRYSWHIWQCNARWVCTTYDTSQVDGQLSLRTKQILSESIRSQLRKEQLNKQYLIIHETLEYDEHGQAYVAYSCPIALE